jgi:hypothetical protein
MSKKEKLKGLIKGLLKEKKAVELTEFERKRREFADRIMKGYSPSTGELANYIEGLTHDGYDRQGRKVSFIERGESIFGRRSGLIRLSGERENKLKIS